MRPDLTLPRDMLSQLIEQRKAPQTKSGLANTSEPLLKVGSRCRLSALGSKSIPRQVDNYCTVVGEGKTKNKIPVRFDGVRTAQTLHSTYLELAPRPGRKRSQKC